MDEGSEKQGKGGTATDLPRDRYLKGITGASGSQGTRGGDGRPNTQLRVIGTL